MREIKMQPVREGALSNPDEKHELHIIGSNMINVVRLTDEELAALRRALAAYRPEVHSGHYGVTSHGCATPECGIPEHRPMDAQNADYGAACELGHKARLFVIGDEVVGARSGGRVAKVTKVAKIVNRDVYGQQEIQLDNVDIWHKGSDYVHVHRSPAYGAPLCAPGRRIDHEHSVACGPMAGADAPPAVTYSTVRDILRDVQAEVDAFAVGTGTQTLPYVEVIRMIRRVAIARGTAL